MPTKEKPKGGPTGKIETNRFGMRFVELSPGSYTMGSDSNEADDSEKPLHKVILTGGFQIQTTEVTQAQWKAVIGTDPSYYAKGDNLPVELVSWNDCQAFIRKLNEKDPGQNYRLPTEAEWEYACRAGTIVDRYREDINEIAWFGNTGLEPVGGLTPNAWGLYDMLGNVWEWCSDWDGNYSSETAVNPHGSTEGSGKILRGGSWSVDAVRVRASVRASMSPTYRSYATGFRLVRDGLQ